MAITSYSTLFAELNNFTAMSYSDAQFQTFVGLSEAEFNIWLGPNYARETSATLTTNASGVVSLPAGFVRFISCSHATYGAMDQIAWEALTAFNPDGTSGIPTMVAISGTQLKTYAVYQGDLTLNYEETLTGLTPSNTTNWLITKAPQAYFWEVMAQAASFEQEFDKATGYENKARSIVAGLSMQSMAAQIGRASRVLRGATP